MDGGVVT